MGTFKKIKHRTDYQKYTEAQQQSEADVLAERFVKELKEIVEYKTKKGQI